MRVEIMTMHRVPNYGSFMQAYALKKMIESLGHKVSFVDFRVEPDIEHRDDKLETIRCRQREMKQALKASGPGRLARKIVRRGKETPHSTMYSCNDMLGVSEARRYQSDCDVLVIGSDEVFNCLQLGPNIGYSLELFGRNAKAKEVVSYAASFGNTTISKLRNYGVDGEIAACLKKIAHISVRDANSLQIVETLLGEKPSIHFDPVLVGGVEGESWRPINEKGYVILYGYANRFTEEECAHVLGFAHARGLEVIALGESQPICDRHIRCRPDEVISYFRNADYVVTDTFHGTIFSVICHAPFVTIPRMDRNGQGGNTEKLTSLLRDLGLRERGIRSLDELKAALSRPLDFSSADRIREAEARRSLSYLDRCMSTDD